MLLHVLHKRYQNSKLLLLIMKTSQLLILLLPMQPTVYLFIKIRKIWRDQNMERCRQAFNFRCRTGASAFHWKSITSRRGEVKYLVGNQLGPRIIFLPFKSSTGSLILPLSVYRCAPIIYLACVFALCNWEKVDDIYFTQFLHKIKDGKKTLVMKIQILFVYRVQILHN